MISSHFRNDVHVWELYSYQTVSCTETCLVEYRESCRVQVAHSVNRARNLVSKFGCQKNYVETEAVQLTE